MAKKWVDLTDEQKQRAREASARYRARNRERLNEGAREQYAVKRDRIAERKRAAYAKRRDQDPDAHRAKQREKYDVYGRDYAQAWARANPDKVARNRKKWRAQNAKRAKELHLLSRFGLDAAAYDEMLAGQNGVCAICGRPEWRVDKRTEKPRALAVDHCHDTGRVRGLLCFSCNVAVGFLENSPEFAEAAAQYLRRGDR